MSHAPPPAVIDIATKTPVTITPSNMAPREETASSWPATNKTTKYNTIGDKTGSIDGTTISLIADLVKRSTDFE